MPKKIAHKLAEGAISPGFTLIELLVVISIMALLAGAVIFNIAGQRAARDIGIAENELVSNIRLAQSNTLSSQNLPSGQSVQYYLLRFDLSKPTQYTLEAMYNVSSAPQLADVQTINLPSNIYIASTTAGTYPINITSRPALPALQPIESGCGLLAFGAPFGKVFFNDGCQITNPGSGAIDPTNVNDDYGKIINFVTSIACTNSPYSYPPTPLSCSLSANSVMSITLRDRGNTVSKTVTVNGITGTVTFN